MKKKRKTIETWFCYAHCTIFNNAFDFLCVYFGIFWFYYNLNVSSPVILTWFFNQLWIISKWSLVQCKKALLLTSQYCKHSLLTVYNIWWNFFFNRLAWIWFRVFQNVPINMHICMTFSDVLDSVETTLR